MQSAARDDVRTRLQPGTRVGKDLVIRSVLGRGGTAVVYEALHSRLGVCVALKLADVAPIAAAEAAARIEREAVVCSTIRDSHIPQIYDVSELPDGRPYMVMELITGRTLEERLMEGPVAPGPALQIAHEILCALEAVHASQVVHRDLKPANIILRDDEKKGATRVCLMDFGVSKSTAPARLESPAITRQGAIVGTPLYMAPEQISDEGLDERTDLYAVGVVLYEMLTGRQAFAGHSTAEVMAAVLRHDYAALSERWPAAPAKLVAFVARAMAERPEDRFASAVEMRAALDEIRQLLVNPVPARTTHVPPTFRGGRRVPLALGVAAACLGAVLWTARTGSSTVPATPRAGVNAPPVANANLLNTVPQAQPLAPAPEATGNAVRDAAAAPPDADDTADSPLTARAERHGRTTEPPEETEADEPSPVDASSQRPLIQGPLLSDYLQQLDSLRGEVDPPVEREVDPPVERENVEPAELPANPFTD